MTHSPRTLLINPTITARKNARFPLALLYLAAALDQRGSSEIIDGNVERNFIKAALRSLEQEAFDVVGVSVMGGPQVAAAIEVSKAIRERFPSVPIVWGSYFSTLYPDTSLAAPYVDYVIRGQGDDSFPALVDALASGHGDAVAQIAGVSWKGPAGVVHNPNGRFHLKDNGRVLPYEKLGDPRIYPARTYLGRRTVAHQAAMGCRYHCTFCGVAAMFGGTTVLPPAARLERDLRYLKDVVGADSVQYFDHNFFDREQDMVPLLEVMARMELPWWCFARSDALVKLSESSWRLVRKSRLRMAYIGAESPSDALLHDIRKGTRSDQTLGVVEVCARHGVIPELSFMVAPPQNTEEETERTFEFIRELKRINPATEIVIYIYTPLPDGSRHEKDRVRHPGAPLLDLHGEPLVFPATPDEWTQQRWVDYACHNDAPWLTEKLRRRIHDFVTVLRCRYPTVQDLRSPPWAKRALSTAAGWRYRLGRYDRPWELDLANRLVRLRLPQAEGL